VSTKTLQDRQYIDVITESIWKETELGPEPSFTNILPDIQELFKQNPIELNLILLNFN